MQKYKMLGTYHYNLASSKEDWAFGSVSNGFDQFILGDGTRVAQIFFLLLFNQGRFCLS